MTKKLFESFGEFVDSNFAFGRTLKSINEDVFTMITSKKNLLSEEELSKYAKAFIIKEDEDGTEEIEVDEEQVKKDAKKYSYLQNSEEIELIKTYQADPDSEEGREALTKLVDNKSKYIQVMIRRFLNRFPEQARNKDDFYQECMVKFLKAVDDFDPNSGTIFTSYITKIINGTLINLINPLRQTSIVDGKGNSHGENRVSVTSLDQTVGGDSGEYADKEESAYDKVADTQQTMPWEDTDDEKITKLHELINRLPNDEQDIIKRIYWPTNGKPAKLKDLMAIYGCSGGKMSLWIKSIMTKLKGWLEEEDVHGLS